MRRAAAMLVVWLVAVTAFGETGKPRTDLNLRTAPNARKSKVIAVLATTDTFEILETRRAWSRVRVNGSGAEGWVATKYVEVVPDAPQAGPATRQGGGGWATFMIVLLIAALLAGIGYSSGHRSGDPRSEVGRRIAVFVTSFVVGTFYIGLTLPKGLMTFGHERGWTSLARLGEWSLAFNQSLANAAPDFSALMRYIAWVVILYLGSLLLLGIKHGQLSLFGWGAGALAFSVAVLHVILWVGFIVAKIAMFFLWLFGTIGGFVRWLVEGFFGLIGAFLVWVYEILAMLLGGWWWTVPAILTLVVVAMFARARTHPKALLLLIGRLLLFGAGATGVLFLLRWVWRWIEPWVFAIAKFLRAVVLFVATLFVRLLIGALIILAVATVGQLLLDQINGALSAGRRRRGVIIGAVAIGSSIAVLLFVSNLWGVTDWLPSAMSVFVTRYLHQPVPLLDAILALGIIALSVVGVWRNMPAMGAEPTMDEFGKSMVYTIAGFCFVGALGGIAGETET